MELKNKQTVLTRGKSEHKFSEYVLY
jgi:hypothetical protein